MKKSKPVLVALFSLIALALTGCGKSNNNNGGVNNPGVYNPYGQGGVGGVGGALGGQCAPISGPIPFQGSMIIDSASVYAGQGVGGGAIQQNPYQQQTPYGQGTITMNGTGPYGAVAIQAQMIGGNQANASGQLQLSPTFYASIMQKLSYGQGGYGQGGYGQPGYAQIPCAQVVSINIGHYNTHLYGGYILLSINGQSFPMHF